LAVQPAFRSGRQKASLRVAAMTSSAGLAVVAGVIVVAAGYFLQLGLGRSVVPAEFAFLQETLAFYMMAMLPLQPIGAVVTKQSARHEDQLWHEATRPSLIAIPLLGTLAVFVWAGQGGRLDWDASTLFIFILSVVTGIAFLVTNSLAIGHLDFIGSTIVQTLQASVRVGLALPFVWWGTGARGLWCATAIANAGAALCARWRLSGTRSIREVQAPIPARLKLDFAIAFSCYAGIAVLTQIDLVYARRSFPEVTTYAGAALFGKLVFYLPAAASSVALPMLARAKAGADSARVMKRAIAVVGVFSLVCFAGVATFGQLIAGRLLGTAYAGSGPYITMSGLAMFPYSLVNLFASASLNAGRLPLAISSIVAAVVVVVVAASGAVSLPGLATLLAVCGLALAIIGWFDTR
jgi:hypothetical protein